jgi:hypothetical protein
MIDLQKLIRAAIIALCICFLIVVFPVLSVLALWITFLLIFGSLQIIAGIETGVSEEHYLLLIGVLFVLSFLTSYFMR